MAFIVALLFAAAAAPLLGEVLRLDPAAAGERVLAGRPHAPIVEVLDRTRPMQAPGTHSIELVERASRLAGGCTRQQWTATFFAGPGLRKGQAALRHAHPRTQVALSPGGECPASGYVHLNPGVGPGRALAALADLERLRTGRLKVTLTCTDQTGSRLCTSDAAMRRELVQLTPWALSRRGDVLLFWLGTPGQTVTEVSFDPASPTRVGIGRRIPAPF